MYFTSNKVKGFEPSSRELQVYSPLGQVTISTIVMKTALETAEVRVKIQIRKDLLQKNFKK